MNASQNALTGGVLICKGTEDDQGQMTSLDNTDHALSLVVVEGTENILY